MHVLQRHRSLQLTLGLSLLMVPFKPDSAVAASIGGVLVDPQGRVVELFSEVSILECVDLFSRKSDHPFFV